MSEGARELETLRRWAAFLQRLARAASPTQLLDGLLEALPGLLDVDLAAILLVHPSSEQPPLLHVRGVRHFERPVLLDFRDQILDSARLALGLTLDPDGVLVHVDVPHEGEAHPLDGRARLVLDGTTGPFGGPVAIIEIGRTAPFAAGTEERLRLVGEHFAALYAHVTSRQVDERRRMARLVESLPDGLVMSDAGGRVLLVNPSARRLLRLGPTPLAEVGRLVAERLGFDPFIPEAFVSGGIGTPRPHERRISVGETALEILVTSALAEDGTRLGNVLVAHDVTRQRQLDVRKDEFVSLVSHELRTPLQGLSGALELLLRQYAGELNAKQHRYLEVAHESSLRLTRLVDDLLQVARAAEGNLKLHTVEQDLAVLIQTLVDPIRPVLEGRQIELRLRTWTRARAFVDADRLSQVMANLLSNALKHAPDHGRIDVEVWSSPGLPAWVLCSVFNTGRPIPLEFHERIFEKFEQVEPSATRRTEGAGLGLAICRNIVEAHGGRIWVEPESEGARFVFSLPANEGVATEAPVRGQFVGAHRLVVAQSASRGPGLLLRHALERAGYRVRASVGTSAPQLTDLAADVVVCWLDERHPVAALAPRLAPTSFPALAIGRPHDPDSFVAIVLPAMMAEIVMEVDRLIADSALH